MACDFDLRAHTLLLTLSGSRAYGTHHDDSDVDLKGVAVPPARRLLGFLPPFEQADDRADVQVFTSDLTAEERSICARTHLEGSVYGLAKFARLAADCNPNILEALFCRDEEIRRITPIGEALRESAPLFLSAKARHTFAGYAASQLKRIKNHRRWLLSPPKRKPSREDFSLPQRTLIPADQLMAAESAIRAKLDSWEIDYGELDRSAVLHIQDQIARSLAEITQTTDARWRCAARAIGYDENFMLLLDRERRYKAAMREWQQHQSWKRSRNPARAALEAAHGYDCKHGAHLVRLLRMGREILVSGKVIVWRGGVDAEELVAIRQGAWPYEQLVEWAERENRALDAIWRSGDCAVPQSPDRQALNDRIVALTEQALSLGHGVPDRA